MSTPRREGEYTFYSEMPYSKIKRARREEVKGKMGEDRALE